MKSDTPSKAMSAPRGIQGSQRQPVLSDIFVSQITSLEHEEEDK